MNPISSPTMQPVLQSSTLVEYFDSPRISSGGLYHLEMTCGVIDLLVCFWPFDSDVEVFIDLASPKSQILTLHSESIKMFPGFKSL